MPTTPASIIVTPPSFRGLSGLEPVRVAIYTDAAATVPATAYTAENGDTAHTWPASISSATGFYLAPGIYYVSVLTARGQQVASDDYGIECVTCVGAQGLAQRVFCATPVGPDDSSRFTPASRMAVLNDKRNRRLFHDDGDLTNNWTVSAGTGTISAANDSPPEAGGKIITLATGGSTATMSITTNPANQPYPVGENWQIPYRRPYFITWEQSVTSGKWMAFEMLEGVTSRLFGTVGFGGNELVVNVDGAGNQTLSVPNFDRSKMHRITLLIDPISETMRIFVSYSDATIPGAVHKTFGPFTLTSYSAKRWGKLKLSPASNQSGVTLTVARTRVYEAFGVVNGCSTDGAYNSWNSNPDQLSTTENQLGNTALALAQRMNDGKDFYINHSQGGYRVDQMLAEFSTFVLSFRPRLVIIGSATNSIAASLGDGNPAAYRTQARADYLSMVTQALAAGAVVGVRACDPRHDSTFNTAEKHALLTEWNTWLHTTMPPLGVSVCDAYTLLEDPNTPGNQASWVDPGDHVHLTMAAIGVRADAEHASLHALA